MFTEDHDELCDALWKDLRRNIVDADLMDVTYNVKVANYALAQVDVWMTPERVHTPLVFEPGHVSHSPRSAGCHADCWRNEPMMLLLAPRRSREEGRYRSMEQIRTAWKPLAWFDQQQTQLAIANPGSVKANNRLPGAAVGLPW